MPPPTDREQKLQSLAAENARWAAGELYLLLTIRGYKRGLAELPDIIRRLEEERERVTAKMERTGAEHDALEAGHRAAEIDKDFMDWANAQADAVTDERATTRHPSY